MKKIILSIIFILCIMFANISNAEQKATVNTSAVRVRKEATTKSEIVTVLYEDDECDVLQNEGEWTKINYNEFTGYIKTEFLNIRSKDPQNEKKGINENEANISEHSTESEQIVENSSNVELLLYGEYTLEEDVHLRAIPSITAKERYISNAKSTVRIDVILNNWYKISCDDCTGWVTGVKLKKLLGKETQSKDVTNTSTNVQSAIENKDEKSKVENDKEESQDDKSDSNKIDEKNNTSKDDQKQTTSSSLNKKGVINVDTARVREEASTKSEIIGTLDLDEVINIIAEEGEFYKFTTNSISGYVAKSLVNFKETTSRSLVEPRNEECDNAIPEEKNDIINEALLNTDEEKETGNCNNSIAVVEFAKKYLGYSYVSAGKTPETGFDCSGFTKYVFSNFNVSLGPTTAVQATAGQEVLRENLQIGDLIIFNDEGNTKIGHVGIYIGNNEFIHSANPKRGVVIDNLNTNSYYNTRFVTARRLL